MPTVKLHQLGLQPYQQVWDFQETLFNANVHAKLAEARGGAKAETNHHLIFCQHPHVYTLGKSGKPEHLLVDDAEMANIGATYVKINRGGDITYHGPGQWVVYPILDLEKDYYTDIHRFMRDLEETVIETMSDFGIKSGRISGLTGVWVRGDTAAAAKICAMGIRCSRWVTMHGIALNVNTDLEYFSHIIPCGIDDKAVTSMKNELNREVDMTEVQQSLQNSFARNFDMQFENA